MKNQNTFSYFFGLVFLVIASCDNKKTIPFPENPSGYHVPVTMPFEFPKEEPFQWKEIASESIPKGVTIPFNIDKLPSQPFSINDFKPMKSPVAATALNWDQLEEIKVNLDTTTGKPISVKKFMLPEPIISRLTPPSKWTGTTSGIVKLGQAEGLIGNHVYALLSDQSGSVWISTEKGLSRYKGDVFETYNFLPKDGFGNPAFITDLKFDQKRRLLITANVPGIYRLDISTGIVEHFETESNFYRIHSDHRGLIWAVSITSGIMFMKPDTKTIHKLGIPLEKTEQIGSYGVFEDNERNIWIGLNNKIGILNAERKSLKLIGKNEGLVTGTPYEFTEDSKGTIWISSSSKESKAISLKENKIYSLGAAQGFHGSAIAVLNDQLSRIWLVDNDTVTVYDPVKATLKKIPTRAKIHSFIPCDAVVDINGSVWIGTVTDGVLVADPKGMFSEHFDTANGLANSIIWGIGEDKYSRIWVGSKLGLHIYDPVKERIYLLKLPENIGSNVHHGISMYEDHLLVRSTGGFLIIDLKKNNIKAFKSINAADFSFWDIFMDNESNIWLGTNDDGVLKFNPSMNTLSKLNRPSSLDLNRIWTIVQDGEGKIWMGNNLGVNILDPKKNTIIHLSEKDGLSSSFTAMLLKTSRNEMVVGSLKGMSIISMDKKTITNITAQEGLTPGISAIDFIELNGRIHIGSENGLIVVDRPAESEAQGHWRFTNHGKREGFPINDYNQGAAIATRSGVAWWGAQPILTVNLQDPIIDSVEAKVHITAFNIMDQNPTYADINFINAQLTSGDTLWNSDQTKF